MPTEKHGVDGVMNLVVRVSSMVSARKILTYSMCSCGTSCTNPWRIRCASYLEIPTSCHSRRNSMTVLHESDPKQALIISFTPLSHFLHSLWTGISRGYTKSMECVTLTCITVIWLRQVCIVFDGAWRVDAVRGVTVCGLVRVHAVYFSVWRTLCFSTLAL